MILDTNNEKDRDYDEIFAKTILTLSEIKNAELFYELCFNDVLNQNVNRKNK